MTAECPVCSVPLTSKKSIGGHMKVHGAVANRQERECALCGKTFSFLLSQEKHYPNAGWCCSKSCAQRWQREKRRLVLSDGRAAKECSGCHEVKALEGNFHRWAKHYDGFYPNCKECVRIKRSTPAYKHAVSEQKKEWAKTPKGQRTIRDRHYQRLYGITIEEYEEMAASMDGACWACEKVPSGTGNAGRLFVDHVHDTGQVRGLLCHNCNSAIGHAKDDILILKRLMEYLGDAEDEWLEEEAGA